MMAFGFLFGLMLGTSMGGSHTPPAILGSIPFRCLAAFEVSEAEYNDCRRNGLREEIVKTTPCTWTEVDSTHPRCSVDRALAWEIAGLKSLKLAVEQQAKPK